MASKYNPILDTPPETCEVNGKEYRVNTDFRVVFAYLRLLAREDLETDDKTLLGLSLFFEDFPFQEAAEFITFLGWFINRGEPMEEKKDKDPPVFDMMVDSGRILAAFLQTYRINLRTARIHWWIFQELLEGLPKGTHLAEVVEIRGKPFEKWMKSADRNALQKLKDHYRIEESADVMTGLFEGLRGLCDV